MNVLVDTTIWSLALRKRKNTSKQELLLIDTFNELILEGRVEIIGPIRQEILSGLSKETHLKLQPFKSL